MTRVKFTSKKEEDCCIPVCLKDSAYPPCMGQVQEDNVTVQCIM